VKNKTYCAVSVCVAFFLLLTNSVSILGEPQSQEDRVLIEKNIRASIGWALTKDRPLLESVLAHDERFFIFHPTSTATVSDWDAFVPLFDIWMSPKFKATHFDVRSLRITLSRSGEVAWFSAILDDCGEWEGKPDCWENTRWTGVLEKRDSKWLIVQMHFSFASDEVLAETEKK